MKRNDLSGKVALITGAGKGLGKAMALALAEAGAKLALVSRDKKLLTETATAIAAFLPRTDELQTTAAFT